MSFEASILRKWFSRFKEGHFDMNDSDFDKDRQNALVRVDTRQLTREFASTMDCSQSGKVKKITCMGACLERIQQKLSYPHYATLLAHHWLVNDIDHSCRKLLLATEEITILSDRSCRVAPPCWNHTSSTSMSLNLGQKKLICSARRFRRSTDQ